MPVTYSTATKTARMTAVAAAIDAGAGFGRLEICTAAFAAILATFTLQKPCAVAAGGILTFAGFPISDAAADNTGTAAAARFVDSTGTVIVDGLTVGLSAADVVLDTLSLTAGQLVIISSAVLTHA